MKNIGIEQRIREAVSKEIRVGPYATNRASEIGHDCLRYLVYCRTEGEKRLLHDANLELIFQEGKLHEPAIEEKLRKAGYQIFEQQRSFHDPEHQITGHLDWKLGDGGKMWPAEAKSMSPHIFERVTTMDDVLQGLREAREPWLRKYPAQITCYMALDKKSEGLFILKHKVSGRIVDRVVEFDEEYWESIKMKAEAINFHVDSKTLPGRLSSSTLCVECAFRHLCMPEVDFGDEVEFVRELEPLLERREELRQIKKQADWLKELSAIDDRIKEMVAERNKVIAGRWRGTSSVISVKERKAYSYKRWTWKKIKDEQTASGAN